MTDHSRPSAILVNYVGLPSSIDSLMPDNGLASLAGSLTRAGWSVLILDYATTDMIGRLVPRAFRPRLKWLLFCFVTAQKLRLPIGPKLSESFQKLNQGLSGQARRVQAEIAQEIISKVRLRHALFVGFKLWTGAGQEGAHYMATLVRKACPEIKIFGGGPHADLFGEHVFEELSPTFDAVALGEGEETIADLAEVAAGRKVLQDVPGIIYSRVKAREPRDAPFMTDPFRRVENLDTLADPNYTLETYPALDGNRKLKVIMLDESRGCPYSCNFCFHPVKSGREWRMRTPSRVVDLMERLSAETGSRTFRLAGSNPPPEHRREIAKELVRRESCFEYVCFGHTRSENEQFDLLRRSGCVSLFFGVESGSQRILDKALNKMTTVERIHDNLLGAKRAGIMTSASLIVPCPFDDEISLQETVDLVANVQPHGVSIYLPGVVPKTAWYERPAEFGIEFGEDIFNSLMRYQVRFLMPPPLWDPLPYTMGGRNFVDLAKTASRVSLQMEKRGVLTGVNDSLLLLARQLQVSPRKIRNLNRKIFITANQQAIENLVTRFNRSMIGKEPGKETPHENCTD